MASHDAARPLKGKVALVTGAGRGLGRAFAERLASLGADVAIHGMRENGPAEYGEGSTLTAVAADVAAAHGVRTIRVLGDLTQGTDIARVVETTTKELGPIDILVHNAGGDIAAKGGKPDPNDAVGIREEDVRAVLDRNLLSTILTCQAVAQQMMPRRQGRIVTIGSVAAFKGRTNGSIYAVAKAGMTHYTRCLADQLRSYDITVNCIAPGDTRTGRFMGTRAVDQERMVETGTLEPHRDRGRSRARRRSVRRTAGCIRFGPGASRRWRGTVLGGVRRVLACQPQTDLEFRHSSFRLDWTNASWAAQARYQPHRRTFQKGTGCCKLHT
jgi:3-oxoacyl-[acyl-carrier protein] reductase